MRSFLSAIAIVALCATPAAAQTPPPTRAFANINFGYQGQSQDFTQSGQFSFQDETGTFDASHDFGGGGFFEIGGGYEIFRNFSIGASYAQRSKSSRDVTINALVPHPHFFDTFIEASGTVTDLEHGERAIHLQAMWHIPLTVEFDVTLFAGPSFFTVEEDLIESVTPTEVGVDPPQYNLDATTVSTQKESTVGINIGLDTRYMFTRNIGLGAMLRFTRGSVTLTSPSGSDDIKSDAGGFEIAGGVRFRF